MKFLFKAVFAITFCLAFFCAPAQISTSDSAPDNIFRGIEHLIDSLQNLRVSKNVSAEIPAAKISELKQMDLAQSFQEAEIVGDITIILTNGPQDKLWLNGESIDIERTKTAIKNGKLIVKAGSKKRSKLQLYLPAPGLSLLVINGDSEIYSSGPIHVNALEILLNGTSMVSIRYKGKLDVLAGRQTEIISVADYRKIVKVTPD